MTKTIQSAIAKLVECENLSSEEMSEVMQQIMTGKCTNAQIGGFLIALRMKPETVDEIAAAAKVMQDLSVCVPLHLNLDGPVVDIVGTGGDGAKLFNISTASSFVVAAAGGYVAKHGNRSVSSRSGSADVLEQAGIQINLQSEQVATCVEQTGIGFLFAPRHHKAVKHAMTARRELGTRTLFNILGPITNPARVRRQVIGVYSPKLCQPIAEVMQKLGTKHCLVIHSEDGLDEISLAAKTKIVELRENQIHQYTIVPEDFDIASQSLEGLMVDSPEESLALVRNALTCDQEKHNKKAADIIALNAGAGLYTAGVASSLEKGVDLAKQTIASGMAYKKMNELATLTELMVEENI